MVASVADFALTWGRTRERWTTSLKKVWKDSRSQCGVSCTSSARRGGYMDGLTKHWSGFTWSFDHHCNMFFGSFSIDTISCDIRATQASHTTTAP
eukprot:scaffold17111_cov36-Tisochrysis_lutea.AAC.3